MNWLPIPDRSGYEVSDNTRCDHIYHRGESAYNTVNCAQCGTAVDSSTCCLITAPREHVLYNFRAQTVPPTPR